MNENYSIGIDLGSQNIKIILVKFQEDNTLPKIISKMSFPSSGISFGYINNKKEVLKSLSNAIKIFEKTNRVEIKEVFLSLDGYGLKSDNITILQNVASRVVQKFDLEKIWEKSEMILKKKNPNQIIDQEIINYIIDKYEYLDSPEGLNAKKLESNIFFLTCPQNNILNIEDIIEQLNLTIAGYPAGPTASAEFSLQTIDKKIGCLLVDYGAEKTSILLIEKNKPRHFTIIKKGSKLITEKISLSEKVTFAEAEKIKLSKIKTAKINKIIKEELTELSNDINLILKKWRKDALLPGGVTLTGGGSKISQIESIFKKELNLPIKSHLKHISDSNTDYNTVYSIILAGKNDGKNNNIGISQILSLFWKKNKKLFKSI